MIHMAKFGEPIPSYECTSLKNAGHIDSKNLNKITNDISLLFPVVTQIAMQMNTTSIEHKEQTKEIKEEKEREKKGKFCLLLLLLLLNYFCNIEML
jgi:hypothetical protein